MVINQKISKFIFFLFCFSIFSSISQTNEDVPLNNIVLNEKPKPIYPVIFEDFLGKEVDLKDYHGKLVIINFWATWCLPCREEMPYLDNLQNVNGIKVFPINIEKNNKFKTEIFFKSLEIKNLSIYFDIETNLVNLFRRAVMPANVNLKFIFLIKFRKGFTPS